MGTPLSVAASTDVSTVAGGTDKPLDSSAGTVVPSDSSIPVPNGGLPSPEDTIKKSQRLRSKLELIKRNLASASLITPQKPPSPNPVVLSTIASGLTSVILQDQEKLRSFLTGFKVQELRQELKDRDIPRTGLPTKALIVDRLIDVLHPSQKQQDPPQLSSVNCICGVRVNDNSPMLMCGKCHEWSHIACYGLSQAEAKKSKFQFKCKKCTTEQPGEFLLSSLTSQVNDLFHKVSSLSAQLNAHIRTCNSSYLSSTHVDRSDKDEIRSLREDLQSLSNWVNSISIDSARSDGRVPRSNSHRRPPSHRVSSIDSHPDSALMSSCFIADESGCSDVYSIGHLLKGIFSWEFPIF